MKKILCIFCIAIATIFSVSAAFLVFIFYTESGKNFLILQAESCAKKNNIVLKISRSQNNFEKNFFDFSEIFLRLESAEILLKNFSVANKKINISDIYVTQLKEYNRNNLDAQNDKKNYNDKKLENDLQEVRKNILNAQKSVKEDSKYIEFVRYIIKEINIKNIEIHNINKNYKISDITFKNENEIDTFFANIHDYGTIDLKLTRGILFYSDMFLKIDGKILTADLSLHDINSPRYNLKAIYFETKSPIKIDAEGDIRKDIIKISRCNINFDNKNYQGYGEINLADKKIKLYSDFYSNDFITSRNKITDIFKDIKAKYEVQSDFDLNGKAYIKLERNKKDIGKINVDFDKKNIYLKGSVPFINLYGFKFKTFSCDVKNYPQIISDIPADNKDMFLKIHGENFEVFAEGSFLKKFLVKKFTLKSGEGEVSLDIPTFIDMNSDFSITFSYKNFGFFEPFIKISGNGKGTVKRKNGVFSIDADVPKFQHKNIKIIDSILKIRDKLKMHLSARKVFIDDLKLEKISAKIDQNKFNFLAIINEKKNFSAEGNIILDYPQIKLSNAKITFAKYNFFLRVLDIKFENENLCLKLNAGTFENHQIGDEISIFLDSDVCNIKIQNLDLRKVDKTFKKGFPLKILNANFNLKAQDAFLLGSGNINLTGFLTAVNSLDMRVQFLNNHIKLDTTIHSRNDNIFLDFLFPFCLTKKYEIIKFKSMDFRGIIKGNLFLENFLALDDKMEIRGKIISDLKFSGATSYPQINGEISILDGLFAINDLVLANGQVKLKGNKNKLEIFSSSFKDSADRKLTVAGFTEIFFDDFIPKLNTKFDLHFDHFRLFDSDDLVVILSGDGKLFGSPSNLIIKGEINVHKCEISNISGSSEEHLPIHYKGKSIKDLEETKDEKSVFDYDVIIHGEDIIISNAICEIHMKGDFVLNTYNELATLIGKAKLQKGKLDFFGKRMNFTNGEAEFFKEYPFNPKANFLCERNFGDLSVRISVLNDPNKGGSVNLQSTPSYSTDIILSKVLFGKELQQLSVEEAAELAHAVSSFNNRGYLFSILNTFKKIGIFDTISFSEVSQEKKLYTDKSSSNGQKNTNIKAGKYIGDKVFISVNKNEEGASFDIDYSITPSISIKANTNGEAGISFKYRY